MGCGRTIGAIPVSVYRALEGALTAKDKAERDLKLYTNLVRLCFSVMMMYLSLMSSMCIYDNILTTSVSYCRTGLSSDRVD